MTIQVNPSAMDTVLARIDTAFSTTSIHDDLKARCAKMIERGAFDSIARARYGARAKMLRWWRAETAGLAAWRVNFWLRDAQLTFALAMKSGSPNARLSILVLEELALILRWMRRYHPEAYRDVLEEVAR